VIIAAALIDVYKCEYDKENTYPVNVIGTLKLIRQIVEEGLKPIFLSTDWVFRGDTGDYNDEAKPDPVCEYGMQKAEVELEIPNICKDNYLIVRLSRMYSFQKGDNSTPDQIARSFSKGEKVRVASDQVFAPLLINDAVRAIFGLQRVGSTGIVNVNSPEVYSRLQMAYEISDAMGIDRKMVEPISLDDLDNIKRPKCTNMICNRLNEINSFQFTPMHESIMKIANNYKNHKV
jgi:dTDP-4-dehydrorhamnose reductase